MKVLITTILLFLPIIGFTAIDSLNINDNTILEIKDGKSIFGGESDWWDKYSSGLIAAFTVLVSLGISVWQARKTTKANRANSIAEARIQWIQELRPLLGEFISKASIIDSEFRSANAFIDPKTRKVKTGLTDKEREEKTRIEESLVDVVREAIHILNQIKLFLNSKEKEHLEFLEKADLYVNNAFDNFFQIEITNDIHEDELIEKAQIVLKNAWEQAKN